MILVSVLTLLACRRPRATPIPTELMLPVIVPATPVLGELEDDEPAATTLHEGDLVVEVRSLAPLKWHARMEGGEASRDDLALELRLARRGAIDFGFRHDFGKPLRAPSAAWICRRSGLRTELLDPCADSLARARSRLGTFVAWWPHAPEPAPVAVVRHGAVTTVPVPWTIAASRLVYLPNSTLLLLTTRTKSGDGRQSGGALVPVRIDGGPVARLRSIPLDEVDARDATRVTSRIVTYEIRDDAVRVVGARRVVARADATELESTPIDETYRLAELPVEP